MSIWKKLSLLIFSLTALIFLVAVIRAVPYYLRSYDSRQRFADVWVVFEDSGRILLGNGKGERIKFGKSSDYYPFAVNNQGDMAAVKNIFTPARSGEIRKYANPTIGDKELIVRNIHTSQSKIIRKLNPTAYYSVPKWSPENKYITYLESQPKTSENEEGDRAIVVVNMQDGQELFRLPLDQGSGTQFAWASPDQILILETKDQKNPPSDILWQIDLNKKQVEKLCDGHVNIQRNRKLYRGHYPTEPIEWILRASIPTSACMQPYLSGIAKIYGSLEFPVSTLVTSTSNDDRYYFYEHHLDCSWLGIFGCSRWVIEAYDRQSGKIHEVHEIRTDHDGF